MKVEITRAMFEEAIRELMDRADILVEVALEEAGSSRRALTRSFWSAAARASLWSNSGSKAVRVRARNGGQRR